jgi:hypothetical protein
VLEHEHEQAVRGPDREQVEHDGRPGNHDRPEHDGQEHERQAEDEQEDVRRGVRHGVEVVGRLGGGSPDENGRTGARELARDHVAPQRPHRRDCVRPIRVAAHGDLEQLYVPVR